MIMQQIGGNPSAAALLTPPSGEGRGGRPRTRTAIPTRHNLPRAISRRPCRALAAVARPLRPLGRVAARGSGLPRSHDPRRTISRHAPCSTLGALPGARRQARTIVGAPQMTQFNPGRRAAFVNVDSDRGGRRCPFMAGREPALFTAGRRGPALSVPAPHGADGAAAELPAGTRAWPLPDQLIRTTG
jgi:hypothetical protein